jgi:hypothetical protein
LFSLPAGTEMVHFPALPSAPYGFRCGYSGMTQSGFPHSEIPGSKPACGSPRLIAACHVLHRLLAPRHSPYALSSLTKFSFPLHCVCVVKELPIAEYSVVKEFVAPTTQRQNATPSGRSLSSTHDPRRRRGRGNAGGEYRDRTGDLLVANQALSQLS